MSFRRLDVRIVLAGAASLLVVGGIALYLLWPGPENDANVNAWATLNTADVHALAFAPGDDSHLYFGHHNGLLETRDGGRSWQPASLSGTDAMNVQIAGATKIQIAGHEVYVESVDGGASWQPVSNDLPGLDLHAFAVDPADADHAWTWAVGFGLFETHDGGHHWQLRQPGNWGYLAAYRTAGATALLAVSPDGGAQTVDGGTTWQPLVYLGAPLAGGFAAAVDGSVLYAATTAGLRRSTDQGQSWLGTTFDRAVLAVAVASDDPMNVAVVDESTRFYRSPDGGVTWPGP
jgi:photosystem II stability/assembly factor-like uncharacterized protein